MPQLIHKGMPVCFGRGNSAAETGADLAKLFPPSTVRYAGMCQIWRYRPSIFSFWPLGLAKLLPEQIDMRQACSPQYCLLKGISW